ncbi:hypothetical protein H5P28_11610 [Ruficoccus amylovorans]|uniref:Uncharacterized protein n=1 Tax=Ruficoccus amylovorans TaxID=1804625 RepID=A0A842HH67_9BACT|nr:hypothetical protein [Ruficoccus amylovorans]MBC2594904.1 hypothetical protein [Ruficoccus amylovorans]
MSTETTTRIKDDERMYVRSFEGITPGQGKDHVGEECAFWRGNFNEKITGTLIGIASIESIGDCDGIELHPPFRVRYQNGVLAWVEHCALIHDLDPTKAPENLPELPEGVAYIGLGPLSDEKHAHGLGHWACLWGWSDQAGTGDGWVNNNQGHRQIHYAFTASSAYARQHWPHHYKAYLHNKALEDAAPEPRFKVGDTVEVNGTSEKGIVTRPGKYASKIKITSAGKPSTETFPTEDLKPWDASKEYGYLPNGERIIPEDGFEIVPKGHSADSPLRVCERDLGWVDYIYPSIESAEASGNIIAYARRKQPTVAENATVQSVEEAFDRLSKEGINEEALAIAKDRVELLAKRYFIEGAKWQRKNGKLPEARQAPAVDSDTWAVCDAPSQFFKDGMEAIEGARRLTIHRGRKQIVCRVTHRVTKSGIERIGGPK